MTAGGPPPYTVRQAERTLPLVGRIAADVVETNERLSELLAALRAARAARVRRRGRTPLAPGPGAARQAGPGSGPRDHSLESLRAEVARVSGRLEELLGELARLGCEAHGADGSVDFPALLAGEPVRLCWRPGEEAIRWWHPPGSRTGDRRPIPESALAAREA